MGQTDINQCQCSCHMGGRCGVVPCCKEAGKQWITLREVERRMPFHEAVAKKLGSLFGIFPLGLPFHDGMEAVQGTMLEILNMTVLPARELPQFIEQFVGMWRSHKDMLSQTTNHLFMVSIARLYLYQIELNIAGKFKNQDMFRLPPEFTPILMEEIRDIG